MKQICFSGFEIVFTTDMSLNILWKTPPALDKHLSGTANKENHNQRTTKEQNLTTKEQNLYGDYCKMASRESTDQHSF